MISAVLVPATPGCFPAANRVTYFEVLRQENRFTAFFRQLLKKYGQNRDRDEAGQCRDKDALGGKHRIRPILVGEESGRTADRHTGENHRDLEGEQIGPKQAQDRQCSQREQELPHRNQNKCLFVEHRTGADARQDHADNHHAQRGAHRPQSRKRLVQLLGNRRLKEHPQHAQLDRDDPRVEHDIFDPLFQRRIGEQADASRPHHDPVGDDEQAAQEESILTIGILYDRQARETRIADKGAIFHDAFFPWVAPVVGIPAEHE